MCRGMPLPWEGLLSLTSWGLDFSKFDEEITQPMMPPMPPMPPSPPSAPPPPPDVRWRTVAGPLFVIAAIAFSLVANSLLGRKIEVTARFWHVSFSPSKRVSVVWGIIYVWLSISEILQLLSGVHDELYAAALGSNALIAASFVFCGLWVVVFGAANGRVSIFASALILAAATACAAAASVAESGLWRNGSLVEITTVSAPFDIFAGWLIVAFVLNVGIAVSAALHPHPDTSLCEGTGLRPDQPGRDFTIFDRAQPVDRSSVPLILAVFVSVCAIFIGSPVLPLPSVFLLYHTRGHFKTVLGCVILLFSSIFVALWLLL